MDLNKLYKMQEELDNHIWEKHNTLERMTKVELLDSTILALLVELGELANTTRCFKHWSIKGKMKDEVILDELADVWHFYLSIGNQLDKKYVSTTTSETAVFTAKQESTTEIFRKLFALISTERKGKGNYPFIGAWLEVLGIKLGFTDKQIEQAYLKKHKENYRRQEEGY